MATSNPTQRSSYGALQILLFVAAIILLILVAYNFYLLNQRTSYQQQYISAATDIRVQAQQLAKSAGEAAVGNFDAFADLRSTRDEINNNLLRLRNGDTASGLPASPDEVVPRLVEIQELWNDITSDVSEVLAREELVQSLADSAASFNRIVPILQVSTDDATRAMAETGAPPQQIYIASRQLVLADRMLRHVVEILQSGPGAVTAADSLSRDSTLFGQVINGLISGDQQLGIQQVNNVRASAILSEAQSQFSESLVEIESILASSSELGNVRLSADEIFVSSNDLGSLAESLVDNYAVLGANDVFPSLRAGLIMGAVALALFLLIGLNALGSARRRSRVAAEFNQRNQEAILRLLDEMSSLADGDLTFNATVTEDITGAIADSVNFAVEQLRNLVQGINTTSRQVSAQAQEARATVTQLAEASQHQSQQISDTTETLNEMNAAFATMAQQSGESSKVAGEAVATANDGARRVRETIEGMDAIRSQIQETSKRIKRLGESSQEIGDIVELINGISEQTNMLALNAAIQAASAGGAGRGFAVVADEVQRLAERATNATRRIETLVQTIQNDTSEAVNSMEVTTSQVVSGARTAEDAGKSLSSIETTSKQLADLIELVSNQSEQHSKTATGVARTMTAIRDISDQSLVGTTQTAESVQQLAEQVETLRSSVADFTLPEVEINE